MKILNQTTIILTSHHQTWSDLVINFPHVIFKTPQWNIQDGGRAAWRQRWKTPIFLFANTYTPLAFVVAFNVFFSKRVELYFDTSKCSLNRVRRAHITIWVRLGKVSSSKLKKSKNTFWKFFEKSLLFWKPPIFMENFENSSPFLRFICSPFSTKN